MVQKDQEFYIRSQDGDDQIPVELKMHDITLGGALVVSLTVLLLHDAISLNDKSDTRRKTYSDQSQLSKWHQIDRDNPLVKDLWEPYMNYDSVPNDSDPHLNWAAEGQLLGNIQALLDDWPLQSEGF